MNSPPVTKKNVYVFKILLIGDSGVGKTNLRRSFMGESFVSEYISTVGADFAYFTEEVAEDDVIATYKYSIWDLAGQQKFSNVRPVFYQGAFGALLCFDTTRNATFENLDNWVDEMRRHTNTEGVPLVLIANKMDIFDTEGEVKFDEVEEYRKELIEKLGNRFDISIIKTSAKTGMNVRDAFSILRKSISKWINEE